MVRYIAPVDGWVFISYSRTDRAYVDRLAAHLRERGIACWYDAALAAGTTFPAEIERHIDGCAAFIVVRTPEAMRSEWVGDEVMRALRLRKPVLPLLLIDSEPTISLERINAEDVRGGSMPGDAYLDRLRAALAESSPTTAEPTDDPPLVPRPDLGIYRTGRFAVPAALLAILLLCGYGIYSMFKPESKSPSQHLGEFDAGMRVGGRALSPDQRTLAVVGWLEPDDYQGTDGYASLQLWNVSDPAAPVRLSTARFPDRDSEPFGWMEFTPDGGRLIADDAVWDVSDLTAPVVVATPHLVATGMVVIDTDLTVLHTSTGWKIVDLADPASPAVLAQSSDDLPGLRTVALSADHRQLAAVGYGHLWLWDISTPATPEPLATRDLRRSLYGVAYGPASGTLIVISRAGAQLWNPSDPGQIKLVSTFDPDARSCWDMSPDHRTLATCTAEGDLRLWSVEGQAVTSLGTVTTGRVSDLVLSTDGFFATRGAANDGVVRLWSVPDAGTDG